MKTFKLTITENEMRALIRYHATGMAAYDDYDPETSERIHTLTKRLNRDTPEIEGDIKPQVIAAKEEQQTGW